MAKESWRNLVSRDGSAQIPIKTTHTRVRDFMSVVGTEMSLIPLDSWRWAQQHRAIRPRIGLVCVEESEIELWEH